MNLESRLEHKLTNESRRRKGVRKFKHNYAIPESFARVKNWKNYILEH